MVMKGRLAAAAVGLVLIAAALITVSLSSHPVKAATNTVEPITPSVFLDAGDRRCQRISRVPQGADRLKVVITYVTGGARRLRVEIYRRRQLMTAGQVAPVGIGETLIKLRPRTRAVHRALVCLSNPGKGRVVVGGNLKRLPRTPPGRTAERKTIASLIFLRRGSASWVSQTGTIAERYANAQTGPLGGWSIWAAGLLAIVAAGLAIASVVLLPERRS
jgi:hypothetical protein